MFFGSLVPFGMPGKVKNHLFPWGTCDLSNRQTVFSLGRLAFDIKSHQLAGSNYKVANLFLHDLLGGPGRDIDRVGKGENLEEITLMPVG